ncbi:hypothetical protein LQ954_10230 [Sphingomonas sp. IC-11]|uniref:LPXTG cell wall anchor domain-containing protein n=1 Tax=Sphingomonas sp. IC-11 TaxID=2898528 RepID=UPI001E29590B|nr:LPXTG cell wall anchor domain-containing protein [Sphingomonas sp. IC-11]MCD2316526.1 hypothetical protein [Sphingomonas sp. IC-11]
MAGVTKMRLAAGVAALCMAGMASAQVPPTTVPDVGNYSLPESPRPAQQSPLLNPAPTPSPAPTEALPVIAPPAPTPTATPRAAPVRTPNPTPTRAPAPRATPTPTPSPRATAAPSAAATPAATREAVPAATPAAPLTPEVLPAEPSTADTPALPVPAAEPTAASVEPATGGNGGNWLWTVLIGVLVLAGAGLFLWRRRASRMDALPAPMEPAENWSVADEVAEPAPAPAPSPVVPPAPVQPPASAPQAPAPVTAAPRFLDLSDKMPPARIEVGEPVVRRAGLNMITATADLTVEVRNVSDVPARGVTLDVRLASAQPNQDAAIAAMFAGPVPRPAAPPFDLAPGESRRVRTLVTMARDSITVLQAGGRPMFVPVVAIRAIHAGGQTVTVHALGIERPGQAKLGPFWLDQPGRMFDTVGVRPHSGQW